jgi:hypothetical protein
MPNRSKQKVRVSSAQSSPRFNSTALRLSACRCRKRVLEGLKKPDHCGVRFQFPTEGGKTLTREVAKEQPNLPETALCAGCSCSSNTLSRMTGMRAFDTESAFA